MQLERAVILAAGLGTRLKWMTLHRPKALMNIQGEASIVHVIRQLAGQGIHQIVVNTHHHADILMAFLGNGEKWGVSIIFSQEDTILNSGGGVCTALSHMPGEGAVLVHNADVLADVDVQALAELCPENGCALALVNNPAHHLQGDFTLNHGMVCMHKEPRYTFSGVSIWHDDVFHAYAVNTNFSLLYPMRKLIKLQRCVGMIHRGQWFDVGRPKDVMRANRLWNK